MDKKQQLQQIRQDVLSFLEINDYQIDICTKKNLIKGIINNFFDYLDEIKN